MNKVNTREGSVVDPRNRATESVRDLKLTANERKTSQKNEGGPKHSAQGTRKGRQRTGLPLAAERKSTCTSSVTPALDERRLIEEALRRSESREELLADVAGSLLASIDPQPIIDDLANKTMRFLDCEVFFNYLLDEKSDRLRLNAYAGVPKEEADRIAWLDPGVAVCGCVARDGRRIVAEDIQATEDPRMDLVRSYGVQAYACHPLLIERRPIGTLSFGSKRRKSFTVEELSLMKTVSDHISIAMNRLVTRRALAENEARYRGLFEAVQEIFFVEDIVLGNDGKVVDWVYEDLNPAGLKLLGLADKEQVRGKRATEILGEKTVSFYLPMIEQARRAAGKPVTVQYRSPISKGREFLVSNLVLGTSLISTQTDITEIADARRQAEEYARRLERSNAELRQFAYVSSHDLQEPLRMITQYLGLLERRYGNKLDDRAKEYMGYVVEGATRINQMINDLLVYSSVQSQENAPVDVDLNIVLSWVMQNIEPIIISSGGTVRYDPLPAIRGDYLEMTQLFQNLIGNALKFHTDEPPDVRVFCRENDDQWIFSVQDNGIGISPKYHKKVFEMFQRLHTRDLYEGSGIGLPICKKIVEGRGGRIWVESDGRKGSTFFFALPK